MIRFMTTCAAAIALSGTLMIASAETSVTSTTGEAGGVVVVRGGETFSLGAGDPLFEGDRIVTRSEATAEIAGEACTRSIPASSTIIIGDDFCTAVIASADETILADAGEIATGNGIGAAMPLAALAGLGTAAAASGGRSGGNGRASSP
jgi:hypothetical protein